MRNYDIYKYITARLPYCVIKRVFGAAVEESLRLHFPGRSGGSHSGVPLPPVRLRQAFCSNLHRDVKIMPREKLSFWCELHIGRRGAVSPAPRLKKEMFSQLLLGRARCTSLPSVLSLSLTLTPDPSPPDPWPLTSHCSLTLFSSSLTSPSSTWAERGAE